jgi:chromosomal replication initiation ATPase DnaA
MIEEHDIPWSMLVSPSRKEYLKGPRRKIWAMLQREGLSLPQIGKMFNRDHTTILHGINATR